jgi:hypothetical protein
MTKRQYIVFSLFGLLPMSVVLLVFAYLGGYTRFIADDYCSVYYAQELGFFDSVLFSYRTINGRYAAYGTDWLILNLFDAYRINLIPQIALAGWFVFFVLAIYWVLKFEQLFARNSFWAVSFALLALFLIMILSPNIPQSLYWWNGMRSYALPLIVLTLGGGILYLFARQAQTMLQIFGGVFFSFVFFFANGGLSETYLVLQILVLAFFIVMNSFVLRRDKTSPLSLFLYAGLLGTLLSLALVLHSHANVIRRSVMPPAPSAGTLMRISWESYLLFWAEILTQPKKTLALLGVIFAAMWFGANAIKRLDAPWWKIALYFLAGLGFLFSAFVPGVYGYVKFPPTRTLITGVFFFTLFTLYAAFLLGNRFLFVIGKYKTGVLLFSLVFLFASATMVTQSLFASRQTYLDFAEKWDRVDAQILAAKNAGEESILIPGMDNWAKLDRPNDNPKFWATRCYSLYYGVQIYGPPY